MTLPMVDVFNVPSRWLVTARPIYTLVPIAIVADPIEVQLVPFADQYAVNVFPLRTIRTQYGVLRPVVPLCKELPPVLVRR